MSRFCQLPVRLGRIAVLALLAMFAFSLVAISADSAAADNTPKRRGPGAVQQRLLVDRFERFTAGTSWDDGTYNGTWRTVFTGYGSVGIGVDGSKVITQKPQVSTSYNETHASLVTSTATFTDVNLTARMRTVRQLRTGDAPKPWETAWLLWNYTDNYHFYYIVLKPNGWELGKEDPAYPGAQRFLATGSDKTFPVGKWYTVNVVQVGNRMTVSVDGEELVSFTDNERPYRGGGIGLYNEDAEVAFDDIIVKAP